MDIDPRDTRLRLMSLYYTPGQLMALGRIAELSALLEVHLRIVLGQVLGLGVVAGEALFLGDRASNLVTRFKEVGKFVDMPEWFSDEAVDWAKRVGTAIDERDDVLHRAPVMLARGDDEGAGEVVGWNRARRTHQRMPIDDQRLLDLVDRLAKLEDEVMEKLVWGKWETSVNDAKVDRGSDARADEGP